MSDYDNHNDWLWDLRDRVRLSGGGAMRMEHVFKYMHEDDI